MDLLRQHLSNFYCFFVRLFSAGSRFSHFCNDGGSNVAFQPDRFHLLKKKEQLYLNPFILNQHKAAALDFHPFVGKRVFKALKKKE